MSLRLLWAAMLLCAVPAGANAAGSDSLVASGQSVSFDSQVPSGGIGSLDWIHQDANHQLWDLGSTGERFGDSYLTMARVMGSFNVGAGNSLAATLEEGPAATDGSRYTFNRVTLEALHPVSASLQLGGGGQYVDADGVRVFLVRMEAIWVPQGPLSLRAQLGDSAAGNLPSRFASLRADYVKRIQLYAGVSTGKGAQSIVEFGSVRYQHFTEEFVGFLVPTRSCTAGVSWDRLQLGNTVRRTATLTLTVPIAWST
jgi:hypothetical protein